MMTAWKYPATPLLAAMALLAAGAAKAAVTYSGVVDIPIPTSFNGVYLDLAVPGGNPSEPSDSADDIQFDSYTQGYNEPTSWDVNFFFGGIGIAYSDTFSPFVDGTSGDPNAVTARSQILNVAFGTPIQSEAAARSLGINTSFGGSGTSNGGNGESHFNTPDVNNSSYSAFTSESSGYIAFSLATGSGTQYGWMRVTLDNDGPNGAINGGTIHEWAYSDESTFTVGQIPEPGSLVLLLLGSLGLLRRRRA